ncbi:MAG TPA: helix-turn-helix transcriptional regulator [Bdellovibrio sp.]|uniref:PadR family transcriptional regulator n=1 Tax=Bdellovibrio sp. TaxID=28201 RepID=UPI002F20B78A
MKKSEQLTAADLTVISLLAEEPMHGYKIVAELERRDAKDWAPISRPQVYYSIKKLLKLKMIGEASDAEEPLGPEREKYRLNAKGKDAMKEALSDRAWATQRPPAPFVTWMALSTHLSATTTREIIEARRRFLESELSRERKTLSEFEAESDSMVVAGKLMVSFCIRSFELELSWLTEVLRELPKSRAKNS